MGKRAATLLERVTKPEGQGRGEEGERSQRQVAGYLTDITRRDRGLGKKVKLGENASKRVRNRHLLVLWRRP